MNLPEMLRDIEFFNAYGEARAALAAKIGGEK